MKINKTNYEIYILDYYEGKLTKIEVYELFSFLEHHPEIKAEFDNFENISIAYASSIHYEFKESLKKTESSSVTIINSTNYNEFFIADIEGDLSISQQKQLEVFLAQHTSLQNEYRIFKLCKLQADPFIVFENKNQLKKFLIFNIPIHKKLIYRTAAIAASFLLMASIASFYFTNTKNLRPDATAINNKQNSNNIPIAKSGNIASNILKEKKPEVITVKRIANKKQASSAAKIKNPMPEIRIPNELKSMASIQLSKIKLDNTNQNIEQITRHYYTSINDELAFTDIQRENNNTQKLLVPQKTPRFQFDTDLIKDQPIAKAGGFLRTVAVLGYSKIEELGTSAKETYLALEQKLSKK